MFATNYYMLYQFQFVIFVYETDTWVSFVGFSQTIGIMVDWAANAEKKPLAHFRYP